MPCYSPNQAVSFINSDGKKRVRFCAANQHRFMLDKPTGFEGQVYGEGKWRCVESNLVLPCGQCIGCRLEKSRQWAVRIMHEAKMYERNSFITLTYAPEHLPQDRSLSKEVIPLFMKRLRDRLDHKVRVFYCGEYGDRLGRPHYHLCLFNHDFKDKKFFSKCDGYRVYWSRQLEDLWPYGFNTVGALNFETAAYTARYVTKKVTGDKADDHYTKVDENTGEVFKLLPEFAKMSNRSGIGKAWYDKYASTDLFPHGTVVVRGHECKPPRYYDKLWEQDDPEGYELAKELRKQKALMFCDDNTFRRLQDRMKCQEAKMKMLVRKMEK